MTDWMEAMGLHHFGFDDNQIAKIDAMIPRAAYVFRLAKQNKTVLAELIDAGEMIFSQLAQYRKEQQ